MSVRAILSKIESGRGRAEEFRRRWQQQPARGAQLCYLPAKELQMTFQGIPKNRGIYVLPQVYALVEAVVEAREASFTYFNAAGSLFDAAMELSRSAQCQENFARVLMGEKAELAREAVNGVMPLEIMGRAIEARYRSVKLLRQHRLSPLKLAFELSYLSCPLYFLWEHSVAGYAGAGLRDRLISNNSEAGHIFRNFRKFGEANTSYRFLARLFADKVKEDPSFYEHLGRAAMNAGSTARLAGLEQATIAGHYGEAAMAFEEMAGLSQGERRASYLRRAQKAREKGGLE